MAPNLRRAVDQAADDKRGSAAIASWRRLRINESSMMPFADPAGRLIIGSGICLLATLSVGVPVGALLLPWMWFLVCFGAAMVGSAIAQIRRNARFRREMNRAEREWDALSLDAFRAERHGANLTRLLQARGYRDYFARVLQQRGYRQYLVRRWLIRRLQRKS